MPYRVTRVTVDPQSYSVCRECITPFASTGTICWHRHGCSLTDQRINCKLKTKIANTILLLCYLDKMCLSPSGGLWQAWHFYIVRESIKGSPSRQPALSRLHYILQSTPLSKKEVGHSGTVSLFSFPPEILLHIVYISNILCGLKVIDSRRLQ